MSEQQASQAEEQTPVIGLAGKRKWGYKVSQVDDFLEHAHDLYEREEPALTQEEIQLQSFDLEHNGYVIGQVDATLIRLEKAVVDKQTQWDIIHSGRAVWDVTTHDLALSLKNRAERDRKERFKSGEKRTPSYDKKQVDLLVDQTWSHIARTLDLPMASAEEVKGADQVSAAQVANVIFTQRRGKNGYDESSVDSYLNRIIQILTRLESIVRVSAGAEVGADFTASAAPSASSVAAGLDNTPLAERTATFSPLSDEPPAEVPQPQIEENQGATEEVDSHESSQSVSSLAGLVHTATVENGIEDDMEDAEQAPPSFAPQEVPASRAAKSAKGSFFDFRKKREERATETAATDGSDNKDNKTGTDDAPNGVVSEESHQNDTSFDQLQAAFDEEPAAHPSQSEVPLPSFVSEVQPEPVQKSFDFPIQSEVPAGKDLSTSAVESEPEPVTEHETVSEGDKIEAKSETEADPDKYISSLLNHTSVQTSSFEIPNLTFPTVGGAEQDEKGNSNR
jgi:DivIVA domain-containing protein